MPRGWAGARAPLDRVESGDDPSIRALSKLPLLRFSSDSSSFCSQVTHEPHFCLLREVVSFSGGSRGRPSREVLENPCQESFILFQIGLLREYLELEFRSNMLPFAFDVERIIDDFVLFCMLIGNDFLPGTPGHVLAFFYFTFACHVPGIDWRPTDSFCSCKSCRSTCKPTHTQQTCPALAKACAWLLNMLPLNLVLPLFMVIIQRQGGLQTHNIRLIICTPFLVSILQSYGGHPGHKLCSLEMYLTGSDFLRGTPVGWGLGDGPRGRGGGGRIMACCR